MSHQARSRFCEPSLCATKYLETRNLSNENSTRQFEAIASLISRHFCLCKASMLHSKSYSLSSHYLSTFAKQHSLVHYLVANWKLHNKGQRFRNKHIQEKGLCAQKPYRLFVFNIVLWAISVYSNNYNVEPIVWSCPEIRFSASTCGRSASIHKIAARPSRLETLGSLLEQSPSPCCPSLAYYPLLLPLSVCCWGCGFCSIFC